MPDALPSQDDHAPSAPSSEAEECFLCDPDPALVYLLEPRGIALVGLGPLVPGYTVVGSPNHIRSSADGLKRGTQFIAFAEDVRAGLTDRYGACVVTEHGRMPVCRQRLGLAERHCYHAHFLLFPVDVPIVESARPYFEEIVRFTDLTSAVQAAAEDDREYFLISPAVGDAYLMRQPRRLMRQFSRCLIAAGIGSPELADWTTSPAPELAASYAAELKRLFEARK